MLSRRYFSIAVFTAIFISVSIVALTNISAILSTYSLVAQGYWLETKVWKGKLLESIERPDVVIVGSSRVMNHIDTHQGGLSGIKSFNYGIGGLTSEDFPYSVAKASAFAKSIVVISFPAERLFSRPQCPQFWTFSDLRFYAKQNPGCITSMTSRDWLSMLPINAYFFSFTEPTIHRPCENPEGKTFTADIQKQWARNICDESRPIARVRGFNKRWVVIYENGDGEIISQNDVNWLSRERHFDFRKRPLDDSALRFIRSLADLVEREGKTPVLLIEAAPVLHVQIEKNLERLLGIKTIYMTDMRFSPNEIADLYHGNRVGKERISKFFWDSLAPLMDKTPPSESPPAIALE